MKRSFLFLAVLLTAILASSCGKKIYTKPDGIVFDVDGRAVWVCFPVVDGIDGNQGCNWYYFENGHSYRSGDVYPDFEKHFPQKSTLTEK